MRAGAVLLVVLALGCACPGGGAYPLPAVRSTPRALLGETPVERPCERIDESEMLVREEDAPIAAGMLLDQGRREGVLAAADLRVGEPLHSFHVACLGELLV